MKKKWIVPLLAIVLCLGLLPANAQASGTDEEIYRECRSYDELVQALASSAVREIGIRPRWEEIHESGEYEYFSWPEGEVTLTIQSAGWPNITVYDNWTIPENVTVESYRSMNIGSNTITVNGDWYGKSNQGGIVGQGGTVIFNGDVYLTNSCTFISASQHVFNGDVHIDGSNVWIANMVLGNGAKVSGQEFQVWNSLSCPSGTATVESDVQPHYNRSNSNSTPTVTLSGNLKMGDINVRSADVELVIGAGSQITVGRIYMFESAARLTIHGQLTFPGDEQQGIGDIATVINQGGVLIMRPDAQLGGTGATGTLSGDGTLKLYAEQMGEDWYRGYPMLYGRSADPTISEQVTVKNIWKNWVDGADCVHNFVEGERTPALCNAYSQVTSTCSKCGTQTVEEDVEGGYSEEHNWKWYASGNTIGHRCLRCDKRGSITLTAANGIYTGQPVTGVASATGNENWCGEEVIITYDKNVEPGENTAIAYMHCNGQTVSIRFSIFEGDCAHAGGNLTCYAQAVCEKCGEGYGTLKQHSFSRYNSEMEINGESHIYHCGNTGCTETKTEAHRFYGSDYEFEMGLIYGTGATSHMCYLCGYGSFFREQITVTETTVALTVEKMVAGDQVAAAVYGADGRFLGFGVEVAETTGAVDLEVSFSGTADHLKVFFTNTDWNPDRPASGDVSIGW